ncbi:hypothetical protein K0M31_001349 [Melipona bicolor]|uniref:Uncharacterized protein n=1 Tax=Melipona bicolor TaxID=60889 RepID=A0AA40GFA7_9HYME|nr:hypothetical protein K0M31_001349 [Melipona bicolor]
MLKLRVHEYRTLGGTGLILDPARQKGEKDDDEVRGTGMFGRNYIFCRQDTFSASRTLASRGYLKTPRSSFARQRAGRRDGIRAAPKGSNPSGSHARVLVPSIT